MYCGEGDFLACIRSIHEQIGVIVEHTIISNQPEREAHDALWSAFTRASLDFDMLTKVDADTVLEHPEVLCKTYELFQKNPRVTSVQSPLYDHLTDGFINGLNSFSPKVRFSASPELYCDRVDTGHDIQLMANQVPDTLRPAGQHCLHATEVQAFHYGLHRALKNQHSLIEKMKFACSKGDYSRLRHFAILGAAASTEFRNRTTFNYQDSQFLEAFDKASQLLDAG